MSGLKKWPIIEEIQRKLAAAPCAAIQENGFKKKPDKKKNMDQDKYIPIDQCKDHHLYIIKARNADLGVYVAEEKGFWISRYQVLER